MSEAIPAKPIKWPAGKTAAASFSFDIDAESAILNFKPAAADQMSNQINFFRSWLYSQKISISD